MLPPRLVRRLAAGLDHRGALVIFPEGGNWTPVRWRRAVARLRRQRRHDLAERAVAMPNVLPPRVGGALAAIAACPAADVIDAWITEQNADPVCSPARTREEAPIPGELR